MMLILPMKPMIINNDSHNDNIDSRNTYRDNDDKHDDHAKDNEY